MTCGSLPTPLWDAVGRCAGSEKAAVDLHQLIRSSGADRPSGLTENEIQKAVFAHLDARPAPGIFAFHPKNGSSDMAGRTAGIYVALGVKAGIPDVIVIKRSEVVPSYCRVYALELKRDRHRGRKPSKHEARQSACRDRMKLCGVTTGVAYGLDEAIAWLEQHGLLVGRAA